MKPGHKPLELLKQLSHSTSIGGAGCGSDVPINGIALLMDASLIISASAGGGACQPPGGYDMSYEDLELKNLSDQASHADLLAD